MGTNVYSTFLEKIRFFRPQELRPIKIQKASFFVYFWDFLIHCVCLCLRPSFEALCVSPSLVTRFFLTQIFFCYTSTNSMHVADNPSIELSKPCQLSRAAKVWGRFGLRGQKQGRKEMKFSIAAFSVWRVVVQRLWVWSEKNALSLLDNFVPFPGLRACRRPGGRALITYISKKSFNVGLSCLREFFLRSGLY